MFSLEVSAPSKLILHGEHSVCYGKTAVAAALDLRTHIVFVMDNADHVEIEFDDIGVSRRFPLALVKNVFEQTSVDDLDHLTVFVKNFLDDDQEDNDVANTALICFFVILRLTLRRPFGLKLQVRSSIPIGAGLGSSAALSVCLAAGLLSLEDRMHSKNVKDGKMFDLEKVSHLSLLSDRIVHGRHASGVDSTVSAHGGVVRFQQLKMTANAFCPALSWLRVLLVDTCVQRRTQAMLDRVAARHSKAPEVITPVLEAMDAVATRCLHFFNVSETKKALYDEMRTLVRENQKLLELLDVSHLRLEQVCQLAQKHGLEAKLTGGGGGGFAYVLLDPALNEESVEVLTQELKDNGFRCWQTKLGAEGVRVEMSNNY